MLLILSVTSSTMLVGCTGGSLAAGILFATLELIGGLIVNNLLDSIGGAQASVVTGGSNSSLTLQ